jgi:hypothetical protein
VQRWEASASAVLDLGTLPDAAPGVAATIAMIPSVQLPLRLEIGASIFSEQEKANPSTQSGSFSLRAFDAGGCGERRMDRVEVGACADVEVAWMHAEGLHETEAWRGEAVWLVLRGRGTIAYRWSPTWAVRADVGVGYDMSRPEFVSAGLGQGLIYQPARTAGRGALGLEMRF